MAKATAAVSKVTAKKQPKEKISTEIKFADYIGKKLVDIESDDNGTLTIKFSNGYNIVVKGISSLKKVKEEEPEEGT